MTVFARNGAVRDAALVRVMRKAGYDAAVDRMYAEQPYTDGWDRAADLHWIAWIRYQEANRALGETLALWP